MQGNATMGGSAGRSRLATWEQWTGIAFVVLFVTAFLLPSSSPDDGASDRQWLDWYANRGNRILALVTGFLIVFAALALMTFLSMLWTRIAAARRPELTNPLPVIAAGVATAGIGLGAVCFAAIPGAMIFGNLHEPGADALRLSNDVGVPMIIVVGVYAAAVSVAVLSVQGRAVGLWGKWMMIFGLVAAAILLASFVFIPMVALPIWVIAVTVRLMRSRAQAVSPAGRSALAPS